MSINRVVLTGNLGADPELRRTQSGMAVLSMRIAVNDRRKNAQTGEYEDVVNWVDCTMFGNRAESVSNYISKGNKVAIEGKLRYSSWERDGNRRSKLEVVVDEIEFMSQRQGGGYQGGYQGGAQGGYQQQGGSYNPNGYGAPQKAPQQPQAGYQPPQQQYQQQAQPMPQQAPASSVYDDDIPF